MTTQNLTLLTDFYELTMMQGYFHSKEENTPVVFDIFSAVIHPAAGIPSQQDWNR